MPYIDSEKVDEKTRVKLEALIEKSYLGYWRKKRLFDIFFATIILLGFLPLMIIIAIVICIDDPSAGPFFKQKRVGRHGKEFYMYKFRTMRPNAEELLEQLKDKNEMEETLKMIYKRFPRLEERKNQIAGTLSGGEQQMLAMGRALMSHPKIILMDEPSMGLSPLLVNEIFKIIEEVSKEGTTVLLVEQNAKKALSIADRAYVLETGNIVMEGKASELLNDPRIKAAYLGE